MSDHRYRIIITFDKEKGAYLARAPELEQCTAEGETREAALGALHAEIDAQVQNMTEAGQRPPVPFDEQTFSGEVQLKISASLHRELNWLARLEELPEEQLAAELFQTALEHRLFQRPRRRQSGPPRRDEARDRPPARDDEDRGQRRDRRDRGGRGRYHAIMDDRANFIEYVRGLEGGGGGGGGGRRGGGGGRRR